MSIQGSTPYGIRFSHKTYRPSPTKDVTYKDPPLIRGPLIGRYAVVGRLPRNCDNFVCHHQSAGKGNSDLQLPMNVVILRALLEPGFQSWSYLLQVEDLEKLKASPYIDPSIPIYGYIYDVMTADLTEVARYEPN
jgi:hypothetical protein